MNDDYKTVSPVLRIGSAILALIFFSAPIIESFFPKNADSGVGYYIFSVFFFLIGVVSALTILRKKVVRKESQIMEKETALNEDENSVDIDAETEKSRSYQLEIITNKLAEKWWVRYLVGIVLFVACGSLLDSFMKLELNTKSDSYIYYSGGIFMLFCAAISCMREVVGYLILVLLFMGIAYVFFGVLAALPVSVAIIIGALIIANSKN